MGLCLPSEGRPLGVTILAVLEAISGVYSLIVGPFETAIILPIALLGVPPETYGMIARALGAMLIIVGLASLLLAWGLWMGKEWARKAAMVIAILGIIVALVSAHFIEIIVEGIIIYYLTRPHVKKFFTKN